METVPPVETEQAVLGGTGVDPAVLVEVMVAEAEALKVQAEVFRGSAGRDEGDRLRDLSPLGR